MEVVSFLEISDLLALSLVSKSSGIDKYDHHNGEIPFNFRENYLNALRPLLEQAETNERELILKLDAIEETQLKEHNQLNESFHGITQYELLNGEKHHQQEQQILHSVKCKPSVRVMLLNGQSMDMFLENM